MRRPSVIGILGAGVCAMLIVGRDARQEGKGTEAPVEVRPQAVDPVRANVEFSAPASIAEASVRELVVDRA
jgi:hypothetical protein